MCFKNSGGMPEFVEEDAGIVVDFGNTAKMGEAILSLFNNEKLKLQLGEVAESKVRKNHDVALAGNQILALLKQLN